VGLRGGPNGATLSEWLDSNAPEWAGDLYETEVGEILRENLQLRSDLDASTADATEIATLKADLSLLKQAALEVCEFCKAGRPLEDCHSHAPTDYHGYAYNTCKLPKVLRAALGLWLPRRACD
jgi:hypothetical protein